MSVEITQNHVCHRIITELLTTINRYRANHSVAPLEYEKELEKSALDAARLVGRLERLNIREVEPIELGENIGVINSGSHNLTGEELAAVWYTDGYGYSYTNEEANHSALFTQLIWAATRYVGLAVYINDKNNAYFVGHFMPRGNVTGKFHLNVFPQRIHPPCFESLFETIVLSNNRINYYRLKHNSPPLLLCLDLIKTAQDRAEMMVKGMNYKNVGNNIPYCNVWENSHLIFDSYNKIDYELIIDNWYNLGRKVDFTVEANGDDTDYFTQMIWKSTRYVGYGLAAHRGKQAFVIHFYKSGNIKNEYLKNVLPPKQIMKSETFDLASLVS